MKGVQLDGESAIKKIETDAKTKLPMEPWAGAYMGIIEAEITIFEERQDCVEC